MNRWLKIGIGVAIAIAAVAALGIWGRATMREFFYPMAPPMPAVVSEPMPEILTRLESVLKTKAPHVLAALQPGLSADEIGRLESQYGVQLPEDIKAIYEWHNGSARSTNFLSGDFIPTHRFLPLEETLSERAQGGTGNTLVSRAAYQLFVQHRASWICLFDDGAGDGYWFDPKRKPSEGAVFYNFTETGSYLFFPSAKNLMAGISKCYEEGVFRVKPGEGGPELDEDFERAQKVWDDLGASNLP